jgi:hypothetical protein
VIYLSASKAEEITEIWECLPIVEDRLSIFGYGEACMCLALFFVIRVWENDEVTGSIIYVPQILNFWCYDEANRCISKPRRNSNNRFSTNRAWYK